MPPKKPLRGKSITRRKGHPKSSGNTHRKSKPLTAKTLSDDQELLQIVLDANKIAIWKWDIKKDVIRWAGHAEAIHGHINLPGDLHSYIRTVAASDRLRLRNAIEKCIESGETFQLEYRIAQPDHSMRWIETFGRVRRNRKGETVELTGTVRDIHDRKLIEMQNADWKTRHELISSSAGLVIYDYDIPSGKILWSGTSYDVLGYHPHELGNIDNWVAQIHPEDQEEAFRLLELAQEKLQPYDVYYRFRKRNGTYCFFHDRGLFIAEGDAARRMLGIMTDVTERVLAVQQLRESEHRFRTLQEASFGGIGLHDKGRIIDCNQGLCDITGYTYEELIGSNGLELVAPEHREIVMANILSGYDKTYDVEGIRKDGTRYFLEIRGKNISFGDSSIRVTEFRDITERKRQEAIILEQNKKLSALAEELRQKNQQLEEFTQIVSHNLRSPVGNILTLLSFYEGTQHTHEKDEYIRLLKECGTLTLTMLNELNEVLKIRQSRAPEKQRLRFEEVVAKVAAMLRTKISTAGATIETDFSLADSVEYVAIYLESIVLNLLDNALKYRAPLRAPAVKFRTFYNEDGNLMLEVSDNGIGINLERYGNHLFKLRKTFHQHPESRGIGLFMTRNQVEAMGGEITVSSVEGEGTVFLINFNKHHRAWDQERLLLQ